MFYLKCLNILFAECMHTISDGTDMFQAHLAWFGYVYPVLNCGEAKYPDVSVKDTA